MTKPTVLPANAPAWAVDLLRELQALKRQLRTANATIKSQEARISALENP